MPADQAPMDHPSRLEPVRPDPVKPRTVRLPRGRPLAEPISSADAGFRVSPGFALRVGTLAMVAAGLFAFLGLRLWSLQVLQGPRFASEAKQQAVRRVLLPSARGAVVDSQGRLLAGTDGRVAVVADPVALGHLDSQSVWQPSLRGRAVLDGLSKLLATPVPTLVDRIRRGQVRSPFTPATLVERPRRDLTFFLEERTTTYPGIHVVTLPDRLYPQGGLGSEFLGLLGEISPSQLEQHRFRAYRAGQVIGQSGVESAYDRILNRGFQAEGVVVDALGKPVGGLRPLGRTKPAPSLRLTIDAALQRAASSAIEDGIARAHAAGHTDANAGAAVVMNPRNGSIYAIASYPDFNQTLAARDPAYLQKLLNGTVPDRPLVNRATQGLYPTGSVFKPIVAEAALAAGLISPETVLTCTGAITVGNVVFHNVEPGIYAPMTLHQALAASCDTWFYQLGERLYFRQRDTGSEDMQRWATRLGLGRPTGIDVPGEATGIVPTPAWLERTFREPWQRIWYEGTSVNLSIGQGYLAVTPLQVAVAYSALANGGTVVTPHVADAVLDQAGNVRRSLVFKPRLRLHLVDLPAIQDALYGATHDADGTSTSIFGSFPVPVAGKTGTAQAPAGSDHSWYASWAPAGDPRVVVVVVIEHGGFGAQAAAPAARDIYSAFFRKRRR